MKQYKDGYDWADKNGFQESAAKYACKKLYQEMKEYYENIISGNNEIEEQENQERMNSAYIYTDDGFCDGFSR